MSRPLLLGMTVVALAGVGLAAFFAADRRTRGDDGYWLVVGTASVRPDGSHLTPFLPQGSSLSPSSMSGDGSTIAYTGANANGIYVSRADGTDLRRVAGATGSPNFPALSRDGALVAFATLGRGGGIDVVGGDGRGRRRIAGAMSGGPPDWSPDGTALVFVDAHWEEGYSALVVQPLRGLGRVLARGSGIDVARWSPDGGWIAYEIDDGSSPRNGLYVVQPNGGHGHRVARGWIDALAWSPNGKRIAFSGASYPHGAFVGFDGRALEPLHVPRAPSMSGLSWSPDGRLLALEHMTPEQTSDVWVVDIDATDLRRVAKDSYLVGWTQLAPAAR